MANGQPTPTASPETRRRAITPIEALLASQMEGRRADPVGPFTPGATQAGRRLLGGLIDLSGAILPRTPTDFLVEALTAGLPPAFIAKQAKRAARVVREARELHRDLGIFRPIAGSEAITRSRQPHSAPFFRVEGQTQPSFGIIGQDPAEAAADLRRALMMATGRNPPATKLEGFVDFDDLYGTLIPKRVTPARPVDPEDLRLFHEMTEDLIADWIAKKARTRGAARRVDPLTGKRQPKFPGPRR